MTKFYTITMDEAEDKFGLGYELIDNFEEIGNYEDDCIWTYADGDDGTYISSGYHVVNRIGYYVSEKPVPSDEIYQIDVSRDVECEQCQCKGCMGTGVDGIDKECEECRGTGAEEDCGNCLGSGYRTEWY